MHKKAKTPIKKNSQAELVARDVMTAPLVAVRVDDSMRNVAALLLEKNISGAPVISDLGQAVGVITKTDIARYERDRVPVMVAEKHQSYVSRENSEKVFTGQGFHAEIEEDSIGEWMTPTVFSVAEDAPLEDAIKEMITRRIHRLFVIAPGQDRRLSGVITSFDLLDRLRQFISRK